MTQVRLLVGTSKGGFILTSDASRRRWEVSGPLFEGWEVYHLYASAAEPDRLWASLWTPWYGNVLRSSCDGGRTWQPAGSTFELGPPLHTYKGLGGAPQTWRFRRVWRFATPPPGSGGLGGPQALWAGAEDAALFRSTDGGQTWHELPGLRQHPTHDVWEPGAGGLCLHTIRFDPTDPGRLFVAISAAGVFRSDDGGATWRPINRGLRAQHTAEPQPEAGYCVHGLALHPARPGVLFLVYVVPMKDDERHFPIDGALKVWRTRDGGASWEPLSAGLPDRHFYGNVLRGAMAVDTADPCGLYLGTTTGELYASRDGGDSWKPLMWHLPRVLSVEACVVEVG